MKCMENITQHFEFIGVMFFFDEDTNVTLATFYGVIKLLFQRLTKTKNAYYISALLWKTLNLHVHICSSAYDSIVSTWPFLPFFLKLFRENGGIHTMVKWYVFKIVINVGYRNDIIPWWHVCLCLVDIYFVLYKCISSCLFCDFIVHNSS